MNVIVTGAAGLVGSHAAEFYAKDPNNSVYAIDNLSRAKLMDKEILYAKYNWDYLERIYSNIKFYKKDVVYDSEFVENLINQCEPDIIIHAAGQPGVPTSIDRPYYDFSNNVIGTFNMLEAVRKSPFNPAFIFTSTNKVFGENVNLLPIEKKDTRYIFNFTNRFGVNEELSTGLTKHTPYGASKLCADTYCQEYGKMYGMRTGIFRMSCIYGIRQLGVEEQGWVAHFVLSMVNDRTINIFGDGLQVRDMLYVTDLINAMDKYAEKSRRYKGEVFCIGGGPKNTISLVECIELLEQLLNKKAKLKFHDWRTSDQQVYISDIKKARELLGWEPKVSPKVGVGSLVNWVLDNKEALRNG